MATEKFHFKTSTGKTITLPRYKNVPIGVIRKIRKVDDNFEAAFVLIELISDAKTLEMVESLGAEEFEQFSTAWQEDSQVSMGESEAS